MITSAISSAARLSLAPARLAGRLAGSLLGGLRGDSVDGSRRSSSSSRTQATSRRRQAQPKRAQARSKRAPSRTRAKARPKRPASRRRGQAQPKRAPSRRKAQPGSASRDKPLDDTAIARKVESTIFRGVDVERGTVDVNVADRVVSLGGEVGSPELISELEARAARVTEVRRVDNRLEVPKPPAPDRTDEPAAQHESSPPAARPDDQPATRGEAGEDTPAPPSAGRTANFADTGMEPGQWAAGSAGEEAESSNASTAGDERAEQEGPDADDLDKDQAYQPRDPGIRDLKGG